MHPTVKGLAGLLPGFLETPAQLELVRYGHDLVDAGMIFGTGFAPFRGGPMHYLQTVGADAIRVKLTTLADRYGSRFEPDP